MSDDHRAALSAQARGRVLTPEHRAAIGAARRGVPMSREQREKQSATMRGRRPWNAGVPMTDEQRARLRAGKVIGDCVYCGGPATQRDHVIPRQHAGKRECGCDRVPSCRTCNNSKGQRTPDQWLADGLYALKGTTVKNLTTSIVLAICVALAVPSAALAATASQVANESLTVNSTVTLTGVPSNIDYGTAVAGDTKSSAAFGITATTNNATGMRIAWSASDLTNGGATIAASNRRLLVPTITGCTAVTPFDATPASPAPYGTAGTDKSICNRTTGGTATLTGVVASVVIPASATPAVYGGTTTFKAIEN